MSNWADEAGRLLIPDENKDPSLVALACRPLFDVILKEQKHVPLWQSQLDYKVGIPTHRIAKADFKFGPLLSGG